MTSRDPRVADRLVQWAAVRWAAGDDDLREMYAEEWTAILDDAPRWRRPVLAIGFSLDVVWQAARALGAARWAARTLHIIVHGRSATTAEPAQVALKPVYVELQILWKDERQPANLRLLSIEEHRQLGWQADSAIGARGWATFQPLTGEGK